jgi:hypothetical protein
MDSSHFFGIDLVLNAIFAPNATLITFRWSEFFPWVTRNWWQSTSLDAMHHTSILSTSPCILVFTIPWTIWMTLYNGWPLWPPWISSFHKLDMVLSFVILNRFFYITHDLYTFIQVLIWSNSVIDQMYQVRWDILHRLIYDPGILVLLYCRVVAFTYVNILFFF